MSKYTKVDHDACISCGACEAEAPDIFSEIDGGLAVAGDNLGTVAVDEDFLDDLDAAVEGCPVEAILVSDEPFA